MKLLPALAFCALLTVSVRGRAEAADTNDPVIFAQGQPTTMEAMLDRLAKADVVFVGENHDHKQGHAMELAILQGLATRDRSLALSLEMFERDVQIVVDEYLADQITESSFLQASRPWPNYKTDYAPMVQFCKDRHLPVIAANAPRRYVNIVSRKGQAALQALPRESRAYLAQIPYSMDLPPGYDKQLSEIFGGSHNQAGSGTASTTSPAMPAMPAAPEVARLKEAQSLWDATMADSIGTYLRHHHGTQIMQVNGGMHSDSGYGIVARLRKASPHLKIAIVAVRPDESYPNLPSGRYDGVADFVILTPEEKK